MTENINDSAVGILQEEAADDTKQYEIAFILKTENGYIIKQELNNRGFSILNESPINKIRLAYPIKKESQAYWGYYGFNGAPAEVKGLSVELKLKPEILRFLIISLPKKSAVSKERRVSTARTIIAKPIEEIEKPEKPFYDKNKILSNEALEKKLEEILQ
ncbi:MAG: 30S ribosomal protein S6 [Candidatus Brennerbacteria bacterium]|nr:30S ribosomal protein S6 [Candidatus Brennerbacteria bacterium]